MAAKPEVIERAKALAKQFVSSPDLMTSINRQHGYVAVLHLQANPCWSCAKPVTYYEAVGEDYSMDNYRGADEPYSCPHCGVKMVHVVPLSALAAAWYWGNPKIFDEAVRKEA